MCDLCSAVPVERKRAIETQLYNAAEFRSFADKLLNMAHGHIKPHSKEAEAISLKAKHLIRILVEEWL